MPGTDRASERRLGEKETCGKVLKGLGPKCKNAWQLGVSKVRCSKFTFSLGQSMVTQIVYIPAHMCTKGPIVSVWVYSGPMVHIIPITFV